MQILSQSSYIYIVFEKTPPVELKIPSNNRLLKWEYPISTRELKAHMLTKSLFLMTINYLIYITNIIYVHFLFVPWDNSLL
jgi:hypothetical protein